MPKLKLGPVACAPAHDGEEFRTAVPSHLVRELRFYRRLWLAKADLEEARAALEEILRMRIRIPRRERPPPLLMSLTTAMVVAYARPWVASRGEFVADMTVPGSVLKSLSSSQRRMHEYLVDLRNREIAHTDADVVDLHLRLVHDGDVAILRSSREAFTRRQLFEIRGVMALIDRAMEKRRDELREVFPNHQWI